MLNSEWIITEKQNVYLVETTAKELRYTEALRLAAYVGSRPHYYIQEFYVAYDGWFNPTEKSDYSKFEDIIIIAEQSNVNSKYRKIALQNRWLDEEGRRTNFAKMLIQDEQQYYTWLDDSKMEFSSLTKSAKDTSVL